MAAADSAPRSSSGNTATSPAPPSPTRGRPKAAGKARAGAVKNGAAGKADSVGPATDKEPTDLEGPEIELEGAPEVVDLEEVVDVELEAELVVPEAVAEEEDDDEDDEEDEVIGSGSGAARRPAQRERSATPQKSGDFVWDEEESEALRQARKDAELTASADSVRAYLKQIGKVALLNAEEEV